MFQLHLIKCGVKNRDLPVCMSLMMFTGQCIYYVLVIYPSLADLAGGESHREHGWQAGGYMNSSLFFHWGRESPINKG